ncbi:MAG TPA: ABC transporter permease [Bryobacteraceae bacterium]
MRTLDKLQLRLRTLFRRRRVEEELDGELTFHLEQLIEENVARGLAPEEARYAALRAMGGVAQLEEECRDARGTALLESVVQDLRYAARVLRRAPGFTTAAIGCLALGIGSTTAVFTIVNSVLLRPLPFAEPERLAAIWEDSSMFGLRYSPVAMGNYADWKAQSRSFESMAALENTRYRLTGQGEPELAEGVVTTASLFHVLRARPLRGRDFREEEDKPGAPGVVIIGYGLWQRRFGGAPSALGAKLMLDGGARTIVGIMPPGFRFPNAGTEIWSPAGNEFDLVGLANRGRHNAMVVARLKPGVTHAQADAELHAIAGRLSRAYPDTNKDVAAFVAPLREHMTGNRTPLIVLLAAVSFVLLIACANVANLMLSRAVVRGREVAIRVALGAGRIRVARQLAAENLLLAAAGGGAGILLAHWGVLLLGHLVPPDLAAMAPPGLDWRVLLFTFATTAATCVLFSLAPIAQTLGTDMNEALKQSNDRAGASRRSHLLRGALVISEIALALVLLIGAGLMIRTFAQLRGIDPGFRTSHLLTVKAQPTNYRNADLRNQYYRETLRRISALPGVVSAGFTLGIPLDFKGWFNGVRAKGSPRMESVLYRAVTPDYMRSIGIPLLSGRPFDARDKAGAPSVALVNETFARLFWPGQDAIGRIFEAENNSGITIVGVVADVKQAGLDVPPKPEYYVPQEQTSDLPGSLVIRTAGEPLSLVAAVRREIWAVDRDAAIVEMQRVEDILDREVSQRRFQMLILVSFAGSALLLAAIGIYGVLSYLVAQRRREIGLRMALGATAPAIFRSVLGQAAVLIACGLALGLAASLALTRLMSSLLFGVTATDPATFAGVPLVLAAIGLAAGYLPARRALGVDPALTLRDE